MNYRKHGLKALGLSFLAVLGFMAFAASGAQASGLVSVLDINSKETKLTVGITGEADTPGDDRLWILTLNMEIFCPTVTVANGLLTPSGHGSGTITFESCKASGVNAAGELIGKSCSPKPEVITANVLALVILHSGSTALTTAQHGTGTGDPYILFTPPTGEIFTEVTNSNEECLLPEGPSPVKGCVVAKIPSGHAVVQLINTRNMLQLFGCVLKYGNNVAHLETDANLRLTNSSHGNHFNLAWGVR